LDFPDKRHKEFWGMSSEVQDFPKRRTIAAFQKRIPEVRRLSVERRLLEQLNV
jgi:hypothetical protein